MMTRTERLRRIRRIAAVSGAVLAVVVAMIICLFAAVIVSFGTTTGYSPPNTTVQWLTLIDSATRALVWGISLSMVGLIVGATVTVVLARTRHRKAFGVAMLCSALFAVTLLFSAIGGATQIQALAAGAAGEAQESVFLPVPWPSATPEPISLADAESGIRTMVGLSLESAVGPVVLADGSLIDGTQIIPDSATCAAGGTQLSVTLSARTGDNAGSLGGILAAWTDAGYASDRAIQTDIRYSNSLPVESLSIRESSTIDGLIHLQILSQCVTAH